LLLKLLADVVSSVQEAVRFLLAISSNVFGIKSTSVVAKVQQLDETFTKSRPMKLCE